LEHVELHAYDEEQMPWNIDAVAEQQCPVPEPYIPDSSQEEKPGEDVSRSQPIRKMSLGQFARSATGETEAQWQLFGPEPQLSAKRMHLGGSKSRAAVSEPETAWHLYEVSDDHEQTPTAHTEKPWHMYEIPDQTLASSPEHPNDVLDRTEGYNAKTHLELPRSVTPVAVKAPDADALYHQVFDELSSQEDEVVPMGQAKLPKFEASPEPASNSLSWSEALMHALQKIEFIFLTIMLFAAAGMEWMRKRNAGWSKKDDGYRPGYADIDMGLVRMAAAASVNQRYKHSASQDIV